VILTDTNVISQPLRDDGDGRVIAWLDDNDAVIRIPSFAIAELVYGYERLAFGRRRNVLHDAVFSLLTRYSERIIAFDRPAAEAHGWLVARLERQGAPLPLLDTQIAAIAISRDAAVATRNVRHFAPTGVRVVDPWAG
jgi:hypothetical protein